MKWNAGWAFGRWALAVSFWLRWAHGYSERSWQWNSGLVHSRRETTLYSPLKLNIIEAASNYQRLLDPNARYDLHFHLASLFSFYIKDTLLLILTGFICLIAFFNQQRWPLLRYVHTDLDMYSLKTQPWVLGGENTKQVCIRINI